MTNILQRFIDWLEDRDLRPHEIEEGEELAFEIDERRLKVSKELDVINNLTTQLTRFPQDDPGALAAEIKLHARELEKTIRQSTSLILEVALRLKRYDDGEENA